MIDPVSTYLQRNAGSHGPLVLMYHSVSTGAATPDWKWAVSQRQFVNQLDFLCDQGWNTPCLQEVELGGRAAREVVITFDDGYADNHWAMEQLARRGMRATWFIVSRDIGSTSGWIDPGVPRHRMLDAGQLQEMQAAGMEIGAHSHRHVRLTQLSAEALAEEVRMPRQILTELLGTEIGSFAYPYGVHDQQTVAAVAEAGYRKACITRPGWIGSDQDPYRIRRVSVFATDRLGSFARKLSFADNDVSWKRMLQYTTARVRDRLQAG